MRHENNRGPRLAIQCCEKIKNFRACRSIEISRRLVREKNSGRIRERARECDPLLLAARKLRREMMSARFESDLSEKVLRSWFSAVVSLQLERHLNVFLRGECRYQLKSLEDEPDFLSAKLGALIFRHRREIVPVEDHLAVRRSIKSCEETEQSRFATA